MQQGAVCTRDELVGLDSLSGHSEPIGRSGPLRLEMCSIPVGQHGEDLGRSVVRYPDKAQTLATTSLVAHGLS